MTVDRWLAGRAPRPPAALAARMRSLLTERGSDDVGPEALIDVAESLLGRLLRGGCATRDSALDLLVADALVTYAFEGAADEPARFADRTAQAMLRIAMLAEVDVPAAAARRAGDGGA